MHEADKAGGNGGGEHDPEAMPGPAEQPEDEANHRAGDQQAGRKLDDVAQNIQVDQIHEARKDRQWAGRIKTGLAGRPGSTADRDELNILIWLELGQEALQSAWLAWITASAGSPASRG